MAIPLLDLKAQYLDAQGRARRRVGRRHGQRRRSSAGRRSRRSRSEIADVLRHEARRRLRQRHRRALPDPGGAGHRQGRRGHHHAVHLLRHRRGDRARGRDAGVRRHRARHLQHGRRASSRRRSRARTKAIMPVHIFGQCVDMDALNEIAEPARPRGHRGRLPGDRRDLQGQARRLARATRRRSASSRARTSAAPATAACITTDDAELAARARKLAEPRHDARSTTTTRSARTRGSTRCRPAILLGEAAAPRRVERAAPRRPPRVYDELLAGTPASSCRSTRDYGEPVYHLYIVKAASRRAGRHGHGRAEGRGHRHRAVLPARAARAGGLRTLAGLRACRRCPSPRAATRGRSRCRRSPASRASSRKRSRASCARRSG